ncbi:hypothetical protein [Herbidospora daliensis]|uniref:hypothetical protein n=1 Tax=Herbidospora daliensis TaxID=295585 RepID=UPI000A929E0F|nr:hypothetical protein [Herbidospora daliensis]
MSRSHRRVLYIGAQGFARFHVLFAALGQGTVVDVGYPGLSSSFQQVVGGAFLAAVVIRHRVLGGVRGDDPV